MTYLSALRASLDQKLARLERELDSSPHLLKAQPFVPFDDADNLPSRKIFDLVEQIRTDIRAVDSLITPTRFKIVEIGTLPYRSAALNAAVRLNIADAIQSLGGEATLKDLAKAVSVNEHKLGRIMRTLTGEYIFQETSQNVFKNTRHSIELASPGARSFLSFITDIGMRSTSGIPNNLIDPETKDSFAENTAPFCKVVSEKGQSFAEYMGNPENATMVELGNVGIVGWLNKLTRAALLNDYPWAELGHVTVIDLGCGTGDSGMDIMRKFPHLKWVYQDLQPAIEILQETFPKDLQARVESGEISFVVQDYFRPNLSNGDVWYLRGVLHEYDDTRALILLNHITTAMQKCPNSKVIINEVLNSSPVIIPQSSSSPPSEHIPDTGSSMPGMANIMTWSTFSLFAGMERSHDEYEKLLASAGLKISRLFQFRTFTVMMECMLI